MDRQQREAKSLTLEKMARAEVANFLLNEFHSMLGRLQDFPDKTIILEITQFAATHIELDNQISSIIIARIVDPQTNLTYKLPTFYLIDSIMKHVGGPYAELFARYLDKAFIRAYDEVITQSNLFFSLSFFLL